MAISLNAAALERSSPASQLKPSPGSARSTLTAPAQVSPPMAPQITTAAIRLFGAAGGKAGTPLPALVATQALRLYGPQGEFGTVKTASLVLHGPAKDPIAAITTEPIRLWGLP
jgi:hypothetical protein